MEFSRLGGGSIARMDGDLYLKNTVGNLWQELVPAGLPIKIYNEWDVEVLHAEEKNPLDGLVGGATISFDDEFVAIKSRGDRWMVAGLVRYVTDEELLEEIISDVGSVKVLS